MNLPSDFAETLDRLIRKEIGSRQQNHEFYPSQMNLLEDTLKSARHYLADFGFTGSLSAGIERIVLFHQDGEYVLKVPFASLDEVFPKDALWGAVHPTKRELLILEKQGEVIPEFFPETTHLGKGILLQEACPINAEKTDYVRTILQDLFATLHIEDYDASNVGWRGDEPVVIDFACYTSPALSLSEEKIEYAKDLLHSIKEWTVRLSKKKLPSASL